MSKRKWWVRNSVSVLVLMVLLFNPLISAIVVRHSLRLEQPLFITAATFFIFLLFIILLCMVVSYNQIHFAKEISRRTRFTVTVASGLAGIVAFIVGVMVSIPIGFPIGLGTMLGVGATSNIFNSLAPSPEVTMFIVFLVPSLIAAPLTGMVMGRAIHWTHRKLLGPETSGQVRLYSKAYSVAAFAYIVYTSAKSAISYSVMYGNPNSIAFVILFWAILITASQAIAAPLSHFLYPVVQRISELDTQLANLTETTPTETPDDVGE